mmetsp:Transcript_13901/g.48996  ORF Transcript_13901/g.48996 Transcript_13901/m.48996 type:complete len:286 (-) Transcript_13901:50-907(-)
MLAGHDSSADDEDDDAKDQSWAAMRKQVKGDHARRATSSKGLPCSCDASLFAELDDKVCFARRLGVCRLHPPTVISEDFDSWKAALVAAEATFHSADLWFIKHRRLGGGASVRCVHGRVGAEAFEREAGLSLQDYVLQANVQSTLLRGYKCSLRCYGAFFAGKVYYLRREVLVKVHSVFYSGKCTDPRVHSSCLASARGVIAMDGDEFFTQLPLPGGTAVAIGAIHPQEEELHSAARQVLHLYADHALLVPLGQYCLVGLDFLLSEDAGAVCIEAWRIFISAPPI